MQSQNLEVCDHEFNGGFSETATPSGSIEQFVPNSAISLPNPEIEKALTFLQSRSDQRLPRMRPIFFLGLILPLAWAITVGIMQGDWRGALAVTALAAACVPLARNVLSPRHREAGQMLSALDDVRVLGPLADMMAWPDPRDWPKAMAGLMRVLPKLKASDSHLLSQSQRSILYRMLDLKYAWKHSRYIVTLLRALEQIGDDSSIAPVSLLAGSQARTGEEIEVKRAAEECLRSLEERLERGDVPHTLLRPSDSVAAPDETLVRPVSPSSAGDHAHLLRPNLQSPGSTSR